MQEDILYRKIGPGHWAPLLDSVIVVNKPRNRLRGLLGKGPVDRDTGLLLSPCSWVHTVGMREALDIAFIDKSGKVVRCISALQPNRQAGAWRARYTLELAEGSLDRTGLSVGDSLRWG